MNVKNEYTICDLHIHTGYAGGGTDRMDIDSINEWSLYKGVDLISTGDCLHPVHLQNIKDKIEFPPNGLGRVRGSGAGPLFVLGTEVCLDFSIRDFRKRIHMCMLFGSLDDVDTTIDILSSLGCNLNEGRPTVRLDLNEFIDTCGAYAIIFPAHLWTPWYGLMGGKTGFATFEQLENYGYDLKLFETGLSSDIVMNGYISSLDNCLLISNSDAHSPENIGREATVILERVETFDRLAEILEGGSQYANLIHTLEWYPHLGKYHYSGHRSCYVSFKDDRSVCPICGDTLTIGVHNRVCGLTDRADSETAQSYTYVNSIRSIASSIGYQVREPIKDVKELLCFLDVNERMKLPVKIQTAVEKYMTRKMRMMGGFDGVFGKFAIDENGGGQGSLFRR